MANFHGEKSFLRRAKVMDVFLDVNNLPRIGKTIYDEDFEITPEFDEELQKLVQSYYMDRFGNVSPVLRSLAEDAPAGMTGPKLIKFLKNTEKLLIDFVPF